MKTSSILSITAAALICAGCEGNGPNTQNGAVAGGALGALAGAVIGNNSGGHNGAAGALIGAVAGSIAGGTLGNAKDNEDGTLYTYPQRRGYYRTAVISQPPPAPPAPVADVVTPAPAPNALWIPGYWD